MNDRPGQHFLELKIPPLAIVVITAALMWLVARKTPDFAFHFPARIVVALGVTLAGITISATGSFTFRRAGTTLNPMKPESSSALVDWGIYKRTRNPMYLGFLLNLLAWTIFLSNWLTLLFLPLFIVYMNRFQIGPEEKALSSNFGQGFVVYKAKVRRWI